MVEVLLQGVVYKYSIDPTTGDVRKLTINDQNVLPDDQITVPLVDASSYIGLERAKEIAFGEAGITEADVTGFDYEMDFAYGRYLYDLEFKAGNQKYEYEIWADSGEIFEKNINKVAVIEPTVEGQTFIGAERAKEIALAHANVNIEDARFDAVEWEMKKGSPVYEVEFNSNKVEYEYNIHAVTGDIIRHSKDNDKNEGDRNELNSFDHITAEEAKQIALRHAGLTEEQVGSVKTELDFDHGVEVYEVEFKVDRTEYEYEINAETGEVIKAERDHDD